YIHALVRDEHGQKMSKSKGNVVDPLVMTERYGTDAFRFTLTAFAAQGRDIKFSEKRVEGYRHFVNKIWNASRFILMNLEGEEVSPIGENIAHLSLADRWILSRLCGVIEDVISSLDDYRFNDAASSLYQFIWHELCDWYIEMVKPTLYKGDELSKRAAKSTLIHTLDVVLRLLHPFMPFLTEEVWQKLPIEGESIYLEPYPKPSDGILDEKAEEAVKIIMDAVSTIRTIRGELNIQPSLKLSVLINVSGKPKDVLLKHTDYIKKLANVEKLEIGEDIKKVKGAAFMSTAYMSIYVPLEGVLDIDTEIKRLEKELKKRQESIKIIQNKLANESFITKAPPKVVEKERKRLEELSTEAERFKDNIERLSQWKDY
ncbi:MAG: valine--tRNA ligase, partial [Nitrospirae bacterium]